MEMAESSDEFLSRLMASLTSGGSTRVNACGKMMCRMVCAGLRPSEREASVCPFGRP